MEFTNKLNRKGLNVNLDYLRHIVAVILMEGSNLRDELNGIIEQYGEKINLHSKEETIRLIKLVLNKDRDEDIKITSESLDGWYEETENVLFIKLKKYRRCLDRYKKVAAFILSLTVWNGECLDDFMNSNLRMTIIHPEFSLNSIGEVSMSKPAMPFSIKEMMGLLNFNVAIRFESNDDILEFLKKYDDIIWRDGMDIRLLISGKVIYTNMIINECEIIPFSEGENEFVRLIEQFNLEYRSQAKKASMIFIED